MRFLTFFTTLALVGLLIANPLFPHKEHEPFVVALDFYKDEMVIYRGKHDVVKIVVLNNSVKYNDSGESKLLEADTDVILFFVEAEEQSDGSREDKGLYVLKEGKATKILPNGRDAAVSGDDSKLVFFGAADGIYVYNQTTNSADRYGTITDSIIAIATEQSADVLYIVTEDHEVFKVSDNGETKEKLDDVVNAKEIVLDKKDHVYLISDDNKVYVRRSVEFNTVIGLPKAISNAKLIKPPFFLDDEVLFLADLNVYILSSYGMSTTGEIEFKPQAKPTAYAPEAGLVQYYGFDKKIYEFRIKDATPEKLISNYLNAQLFTMGNKVYCFNNQKSGG